MLNTIKYTVSELVRMPGIMIWSLVFPLVLMGFFYMMFSSLDEMADFEPFRVVVVEAQDSESPDDAAFASFVEAVSTGEDRLFSAERATSAKDAEKMVRDSLSTDEPLLGYVELVDGTPVLHVPDSISDIQSMEYTDAKILAMVMDEYTAKASLLKDVLASDPGALADPLVAKSLYSMEDVTEVVDVTRNQPKETVRYYFALLGMAALFGGSVGLVAFQRMRPNLSALGARRAVGGLSHGKAVTATLIGCWTINFACLTIAYLAMRYVVGIDFGGRDLACLAVTAVASLTALSLGCAVSSIPKVPEEGKSGMLTGIVCFASLFAGLYGQPTMEMADMIAANAPWSTWVNPASQISQAFYSIMYYDSLTPLATHLAALLVMAAVLFALSVRSLRRQRYASI